MSRNVYLNSEMRLFWHKDEQEEPFYIGWVGVDIVTLEGFVKIRERFPNPWLLDFKNGQTLEILHTIYPDPSAYYKNVPVIRMENCRIQRRFIDQPIPFFSDDTRALELTLEIEADVEILNEKGGTNETG